VNRSLEARETHTPHARSRGVPGIFPIRCRIWFVLKSEPGRQRVHPGVPCGIIPGGCGFVVLSEHETGMSPLWRAFWQGR
jgi:hypothetical protein